MQTVVQYGSLSFVYSCFFHLPRLSSSLSSHISPLPFLLLPSISETPSSSLKESCAVVRQPEEAEQVARSGNNLKRHKYKDRRKKIKRTTFKDIGTFLYILILYLGDCVFHTVNIFDFLSKIYHRKKKNHKNLTSPLFGRSAVTQSVFIFFSAAEHTSREVLFFKNKLIGVM